MRISTSNMPRLSELLSLSHFAFTDTPIFPPQQSIKMFFFPPLNYPRFHSAFFMLNFEKQVDGNAPLDL